MSGYTELIRRWATDTRRVGILNDADGIGEVGLEAGQAGSRLAVRFSLKLERERVADVRYQVFGCGFSMAACAVAADLSHGATLDETRKIDSRRLDITLGGLPADRGYCANLAVEALQAAVTSAGKGSLVRSAIMNQPEHGPRSTVDDPLYAALINSPEPPEPVPDEDRHLFACLFAAVAREGHGLTTALGLDTSGVAHLFATHFPGFDRSTLQSQRGAAPASSPQGSGEVLSILMEHVPVDWSERDHRTATCLAHILAARAALPGHLWVAMGLHERPQLTAAIRRHLPSLAAANHLNMRWKRYLYKQVCDRNGGTLCKAPNCGVCSDYALCFAVDL